MASVVLYFQIHQPTRLRKYTVFDTGHEYFDDAKNADIIRRIAARCYLPTTRLLLNLVRRHQGAFKVCFSITGVALEQFEAYCPEVLGVFQELAATGCCEFLAETYYHSLSFLYSAAEFREQVKQHTAKIEEIFGHTPTVFRNTELIYSNNLADELAHFKDDLGNPRFAGVLCEGVDRLLGKRSPHTLYAPPTTTTSPSSVANHGHGTVKLLLKDYRLSDDIAFRFSDRSWSQWPLTAEKFAGFVDQINTHGEVCGLFMDYETFGEHQWADSGIFKFLEAMPAQILEIGGGRNTFLTPSEAIAKLDTRDVYDAPEPTSWADSERDLSAWRGNGMQINALDECFKLEQPIKEKLAATEQACVRSTGERPPDILPPQHPVSKARNLLASWRKLTTSDHFYYMSKKGMSDGAVHAYFSPYESPYDAFINFMNVLDNIRARL